MVTRDSIAKRFGENFLVAMNQTMIAETGNPILWNDPEFMNGLIGTPAQQKKVGYTDGVTGHSRYDSGGETKFGFAQAAHPKLNVRKMTFEPVCEKYFNEYWIPAKCDKLSPAIARIVFDIAVNAGPAQAAKHLQRALGMSVIDGIIGPKTLAAAKAAREPDLVKELKATRRSFYNGLAARNSTQQRFLNGWLRRVDNIN